MEPNTERFITISRLDDGNPNPAIPKIPFHSMHQKLPKVELITSEKKGGAAIASAVAAAAINNQLSTKYKAYTKIENKHSNTIFWSPKGRYVVVATISRTSGELNFSMFHLMMKLIKIITC